MGWWLAADTFGATADGIVSFVVPILVLSVSGSAALASSVDALQMAVLCALCFAGGVIQDRYDRKKLMLIAGGTNMALYAVGAAVLVAADVWHMGALLWALVPIVALIAVRDGLLGNASDAMLRGIVPDDRLPKAMALNDGRDAVVSMAGGPLGGALMAVGRALPFLTGMLCSVASVISTLRITRYWRRGGQNGGQVAAGAAENAENAPTWKDAFGGLRWLLGDSFQRRLSIAAIAVSGTSNAFLTITVLEVSQGGSRMLSAGFVDAAVACGMLVGSLIASGLVDKVRNGLLVEGAFVLLAVGFAGAAISPSAAGKAVFLVISVLILPAGNAVLGGLGNALVAKGKIGRVEAGSTVLQYGSYGVCVLLAGVGMQYLSYSVTCWVLAAVLVAAAVYVLTMKSLVTLPTPEHWKEHIERYGISRFE